MVYNINSLVNPRTRYTCGAALRLGDLKLIHGYAGTPDGYSDPYYGGKKQSPDPSGTSRTTRDPIFEECPEDADLTRLYDLAVDPREENDISAEYPDVMDLMMSRARQYVASMVPPRVDRQSVESIPSNFGGFFSPGRCQKEP